MDLPCVTYPDDVEHDDQDRQELDDLHRIRTKLVLLQTINYSAVSRYYSPVVFNSLLILAIGKLNVD